MMPSTRLRLRPPCQNLATKTVLVDKTDLVDSSRLLKRRKLLKRLTRRDNSAYRPSSYKVLRSLRRLPSEEVVDGKQH